MQLELNDRKPKREQLADVYAIVINFSIKETLYLAEYHQNIFTQKIAGRQQ